MKALKYCCKCCWCGTPCSCFGIFSLRESISTRLIYTLFLFLCLLLSAVSQKGTLEFFKVRCVPLPPHENCEPLLGFIGIFRICFCFAVFHLVLCVLTSCTVQSHQFMGRLHNGCWLWKVLFLLTLWALVYFFVPPSLEMFYKVVNIVGVGASFLLVIIQQIALIDCAYEFDAWLRVKMRGTFGYFLVLGGIVCGLLATVIVGYLLMFALYALAQPCSLNRILLGINAAFTVVLALASVIPNKNRRGGFLLTPAIPMATTCGYVTFVTWTALSSEPAISVSPNMTLSEWELRLVHRADGNSTLFCSRQNAFMASHLGQELHAFTGLAIMAVLVVYSSLRTSMSQERMGIRLPREGLNCRCKGDTQGHASMEGVELRCQHAKCRCCQSDNCDKKKTKKKSKKTKKCVHHEEEHLEVEIVSVTQTSQPRGADQMGDGEEAFMRCCTPPDPRNEFVVWDDRNGAHYSYPWFHFVYALAALHIMTSLTDWCNPEQSHLLTVGRSWAAVWMKMASSWCAMALFAWSLVVPGYCVGRNLAQFHVDTLKRNRASVMQKRESRIRESRLSA